MGTGQHSSDLGQVFEEQVHGLESGNGVVVSVFFRDQTYLIEGPDFIEIFGEMEGLNAAAVHFRVLQLLPEYNPSKKDNSIRSNDIET